MNESFNPERQNKLAEDFRALHHSGQTLVLPNAWDCTSAKIFELAGFPAIATTSAGIAWACGYQDGEHIPPEMMIEQIRRIARVVNIPVTADVEGGYFKDNLKNFTQFFQDVIEAGAVGINLEDSCHGVIECDLEFQKELITLIKDIGKKKGVNLFINARTDAMVHVVGELKTKIRISIDRAHEYTLAGADSIFVPFVRTIQTVEDLKKAIPLPLNILMTDTLDLQALKSLNVERISVGGKPILTTLNSLQKLAKDLKETEDWSALYVQNPTYPEVNNWFK